MQLVTNIHQAIAWAAFWRMMIYVQDRPSGWKGCKLAIREWNPWLVLSPGCSSELGLYWRRAGPVQKPVIYIYSCTWRILSKMLYHCCKLYTWFMVMCMFCSRAKKWGRLTYRYIGGRCKQAARVNANETLPSDNNDNDHWKNAMGDQAIDGTWANVKQGGENQTKNTHTEFLRSKSRGIR